MPTVAPEAARIGMRVTASFRAAHDARYGFVDFREIDA
jgi:hypothetical protein